MLDISLFVRQNISFLQVKKTLVSWSLHKFPRVYKNNRLYNREKSYIWLLLDCHSKHLDMWKTETHQIQIRENIINFLSVTNSNMSIKTQPLQTEYIVRYRSHVRYILLTTTYACQISSNFHEYTFTIKFCFILLNIHIQAAIRKSGNSYLYMHTTLLPFIHGINDDFWSCKYNTKGKMPLLKGEIQRISSQPNIPNQCPHIQQVPHDNTGGCLK